MVRFGMKRVEETLPFSIWYYNAKVRLELTKRTFVLYLYFIEIRVLFISRV